MGIGSDGELRIWAYRRIQNAVAAVRDREVLDSGDSLRHLVAEIIAEAGLDPIVFDRELVTQSGIRMTRSTRIPLQSTTLVAPMTGRVRLLRMRAKRTRDDLLNARVLEDRVEIDINSRKLTQSQLDGAIDSLEQHVEWVNGDLTEYREVLGRAIDKALAAAKSQAEELRQVRVALTTPVQSEPPTVNASSKRTLPEPGTTFPPASTTQRTSPLSQRVTRRWHTLGLGEKLAAAGLTVAILGVVVAIVGVTNDIYPFRNGAESTIPLPVTTSPALPCPSNPGSPLLQVYASDGPGKVVFHGDGFPPSTTVEIDAHEPSAGSLAITHDVGSTIADGCGKFDLVWVIPTELHNREEVDVVAAAALLPSSDTACCRAETVLDIPRFLTAEAPISIVSVRPRFGGEAGSSEIEVALAGSTPPGIG